MVLLIPSIVRSAVEPVLIKTLTEVTGGGLSVTGSTVTTLAQIDEITATISVSSGIGEVSFSSTGTIMGCSINPVIANAEYSFEILTNDANQFAIAGQNSIHGKSGLKFDRYLFGSHLFKIDNASNDGSYKIRCVIKR